MEHKVRTMLEDMFALFKNKIQSKSQAWQYLLDFLLIDNDIAYIFEVDHKFEWLLNDKTFVKQTLEIYNDRLLRTDYYDHLGEMYLHHFVPKSDLERKRKYINHQTPGEVLVDMMAQDSNEMTNVLDPVAGTGRFLMAAYNRRPKTNYYGVEKDFELYRIALVNVIIHNIPGLMLHANPSKHEIDISSSNGKRNWVFANKWNPKSSALRLKSKNSIQNSYPIKPN